MYVQSQITVHCMQFEFVVFCTFLKPQGTQLVKRALNSTSSHDRGHWAIDDYRWSLYICRITYMYIYIYIYIHTHKHSTSWIEFRRRSYTMQPCTVGMLFCQTDICQRRHPTPSIHPSLPPTDLQSGPSVRHYASVIMGKCTDNGAN